VEEKWFLYEVMVEAGGCWLVGMWYFPMSLYKCLPCFVFEMVKQGDHASLLYSLVVAVAVMVVAGRLPYVVLALCLGGRCGTFGRSHQIYHDLQHATFLQAGWLQVHPLLSRKRILNR
jgi:hypothetical protein